MRGHVFALDGLRGVAILLVLFAHSALRPPGSGVDRAVWAVLNGGWSGVDLFFVLSGFLITRLLWESRGGRGYFRQFYARRVLRIMPLYYLALLFLFFAAPLLLGPPGGDGASGREWWYWLYLANISVVIQGQTPGGLGVVWSLSVEEQFYLVWPMIVSICTRRGLVAVCLSLVAVSPLFRTILVLIGGDDNASFMLMPARMDSFAVGAAVAVLVGNDRALAQLRRWAPLVVAAAAIGLLGIAARQGSFSHATHVMETAGFSLTALFFGALLVLALSPNGRLVRSLEHPILRAYGRYSYAIYLLHIPVMQLLLGHLIPIDAVPVVFGSHLAAQLVVDLVMLPAVLAAGWLSWYLFERHFLALKRFFPYGSAEATSSRASHAAEPGFALAPALRAPGLAE